MGGVVWWLLPGLVLLWESLVEPWERAVDQFEYGVIVTITTCMTFIGFLQGLGIGETNRQTDRAPA